MSITVHSSFSRAVPRAHSSGTPAGVGSYNHRTAWVGMDLDDHLAPAPLPWAGMPLTVEGSTGPVPLSLVPQPDIH